MADFNRHGVVHLVGVFGIFLLDDDMRSDDWAKIKKDKAGPDFLANQLPVYRMEVNRTNSIFEIAKWALNVPPKPVKRLDLIQWEVRVWKVGHNVFVAVLRNLKA